MQNSEVKKILFLTGTRADFGKLKSLIEITIKSELFEVYIFVTGMHLQKKYGSTVNEIIKCGYKNIFQFINNNIDNSMDLNLAKTIEGLSSYITENPMDLVIVHGDRIEALAGAIVGSLNNILVAHIEGGEVSGTIDELIRHSVSKLSHVHFVANAKAKTRLIQMGEYTNSIFEIGSPDIDIMFSDNLPTLNEAKNKYSIEFENYAIIMFHSVTTEFESIKAYISNLINAAIKSNLNYVVIFPNNDLGSTEIIGEYARLADHPKFRIFPSIRFEHFLTLLKNSSFLIGNSSAGIREAPYYGLPVINIGTRQNNRSNNVNISNCGYSERDILQTILKLELRKFDPIFPFGVGQSSSKFFLEISKETFWDTPKQKFFLDLN
jgi:UDP-N-acetylglucosamine 2-epimerase (hydrolysing)